MGFGGIGLAGSAGAIRRLRVATSGTRTYIRGMADRTATWRRIRALRARPVGFAAADVERREVFQSALAQAEELADAAAVVSAASRPLPLFYALSQAGRAICAAWTEGNEWRPKGHGLTSWDSPTTSVPQFTVSPTSSARGAYAMVAKATGATPLEGSATIGQLWASLPGFPADAEVVGQSLRWLRLEATLAGPGPQSQVVSMLHPTVGCFYAIEDDKLEATLADYPSTAGFEIAGYRWQTIPGLGAATLRFPDAEGKSRALAEIGDPLAGPPLTQPHFAVRPLMGTSAQPPAQLTTFWALIYAFSQLARYHPETWVSALDPDASLIAAPLEEGLEVALEVTPTFLLSALRHPIPLAS